MKAIQHNRTIVNSIRNKLTSKFGRIVVLTGARQTGKTTLVKNTLDEFPYISIEDPVAVDQYKVLTAAQWQSSFPKAILDEVQKEPVLVESIKAVYDQYENTRYVLLGSSQILLLKKIRESLAGRCTILELYPLTLPEMLTHSWEQDIEYSYLQKLLLGHPTNDLPFLLDKQHAAKQKAFTYYLQFGAYPAITADDVSDDERYEWLQNYVRTYLERDIRDLAELRNLEPFVKVQKMMALNTAQLMNYSRFAVEAGVTSKTVQRFLEYMDISYQLLVLKPWSRNTKKRLVKSTKVHFMDVGVMRAILQKKDVLNGHEFESAVATEIYKQLKTIQVDVDFYHLRTTDGREVDLLIETEKGYIAIEIKMANTVRDVDGKHLRNLEDILDKPILHRFVLSNDKQTRDLGYGITAMPAVKFLT